jgi:hypothetical protein
MASKIEERDREHRERSEGAQDRNENGSASRRNDAFIRERGEELMKRTYPIPRVFWMLPAAVGLCVALGSVLSSQSLRAADLPAFPGAEGFGAVTGGGRGGKVIKVTNLNTSGPGSLQAACEAQGPRIVVFEVGGVIRGDVRIIHPYITIAGQTAPSPGITIQGRLLNYAYRRERLHDVIVRFLRVRSVPMGGASGDAVQQPNAERLILDHLSLAWANDETIDFYHSSDATVQWCTIEESDASGHSNVRRWRPTRRGSRATSATTSSTTSATGSPTTVTCPPRRSTS